MTIRKYYFLFKGRIFRDSDLYFVGINFPFEDKTTKPSFKHKDTRIMNSITLRAETFAGINFRVLKKREIFDKNFRVWRFLELILRKKLLRIQNKVCFRVKKTFANGQNPSKNI